MTPRSPDSPFEVSPWPANVSPHRWRFFAVSYIPWEWVKVPDMHWSVHPLVDRFVPYPKPPEFGVPWRIRGDGRGPVGSSWEVAGRFRTAAMVEFDLLDPHDRWKADVRSFAAISGSASRWFEGVDFLGGMGRKPIHAPTVQVSDTGKMPVAVARRERLDPDVYRVVLHVKGRVSRFIAGPQPYIDFHYSVLIKRISPNEIRVTVEGTHDGFPAHELFIEPGWSGRSDWSGWKAVSYLPDWFSDVMATDAAPSKLQAACGFAALAGVYKRQHYSKSRLITTPPDARW